MTAMSYLQVHLSGVSLVLVAVLIARAGVDVLCGKETGDEPPSA